MGKLVSQVQISELVVWYLRGVHHEQRTLARLDRATHLISEVDVARRVDQVEDVPG